MATERLTRTDENPELFFLAADALATWQPGKEFSVKERRTIEGCAGFLNLALKGIGWVDFKNHDHPGNQELRLDKERRQKAITARDLVVGVLNLTTATSSKDEVAKLGRKISSFRNALYNIRDGVAIPEGVQIAEIRQFLIELHQVATSENQAQT